MAKDAISGYIASLIKDKEPIPSDNDSFISTVEMSKPDKFRAYA